MKILAIDTTTKYLCLAIFDDGKAYVYNLELGRLQSALLIITIKRALCALGLSVQDMDYFACGLGPGSFTGIRVGLATIKGLAWAQNKPIIGVPTLDILAKNAQYAQAKYVVPVIDAKRNMVYWSIYRLRDKGLKRISPYMLSDSFEFLKKVKAGSIFLGDGAILWQDKLSKKVKHCKIADKDDWRLEGRHLLVLVSEGIRKKNFSDCFKIKPIYLYPKDCQIKK